MKRLSAKRQVTLTPELHAALVQSSRTWSWTRAATVTSQPTTVIRAWVRGNQQQTAFNCSSCAAKNFHRFRWRRCAKWKETRNGSCRWETFPSQSWPMGKRSERKTIIWCSKMTTYSHRTEQSSLKSLPSPSIPLQTYNKVCLKNTKSTDNRNVSDI